MSGYGNTNTYVQINLPTGAVAAKFGDLVKVSARCAGDLSGCCCCGTVKPAREGECKPTTGDTDTFTDGVTETETAGPATAAEAEAGEPGVDRVPLPLELGAVDGRTGLPECAGVCDCVCVCVDVVAVTGGGIAPDTPEGSADVFTGEYVCACCPRATGTILAFEPAPLCIDCAIAVIVALSEEGMGTITPTEPEPEAREAGALADGARAANEREERGGGSD